jgi:hypothetical protein
MIAGPIEARSASSRISSAPMCRAMR